jgi:hypothetical protein
MFKSSPLKSVCQCKANMAWMVLRWSTFKIMSCDPDIHPRWPPSGSLDTILEIDHLCHVCFKLAYWFQRRRFLNIFPIGSYVKTMSADGGHLGWMSGSQDIILKVDHLRTIHAMFALHWAARSHNVFLLVEILKIFSLETTKPIELWLCRNDHWVVLY